MSETIIETYNAPTMVSAGFKSVFKVAEAVFISSGKFTFKFNKREELGMVIPVWDNSYPLDPEWTAFHLILSPDVDVNMLSARLSDIQPTLLLFLRKLRKLKVNVNGDIRNYERIDLADSITKLTQTRSPEREYLVVKHTTKTVTLEPKREGVKESEVVRTFPVAPAPSRHPIIAEQPVHAFLPIRTYPIPVREAFSTLSDRHISCFLFPVHNPSGFPPSL